MIDPQKLPALRLRKGRMGRIRSGHPWVFSNEFTEIPELTPGSMVRVESRQGECIGIGYFNPKSLIAVRWLQRGTRSLSESWIGERLSAAVVDRENIYPGEEAARLVFAEADGLPGLVVDRYGSTLVVQILTAGMEILRSEIESALRESVSCETIVWRDDLPYRTLEGLDRKRDEGSSAPAEEESVSYLGLTLTVPVRTGQKTGLFLDQRENVRKFSETLPADAEVLDVFSYLGAWGMAALKAGAKKAEFVDASMPACEAVERGLRENGLPPCEIHNGDAFEILKSLASEGRRFDAVACDPPAFARSKKHLPEALKAYRRINELAIRLLRPGGLLASCSCSHNVGREEFLDVLRQAAAKAGRTARLLELGRQAPDHPVLLNFPEGDYLKAVFLRME
jgi:23S rRNA (cytosine1962-C5)-methyltransferase